MGRTAHVRGSVTRFSPGRDAGSVHRYVTARPDRRHLHAQAPRAAARGDRGRSATRTTTASSRRSWCTTRRSPTPGVESADPRRPVRVVANHRTPGLPGSRNSGVDAAERSGRRVLRRRRPLEAVQGAAPVRADGAHRRADGGVRHRGRLARGAHTAPVHRVRGPDRGPRPHPHPGGVHGDRAGAAGRLPGTDRAGRRADPRRVRRGLRLVDPCRPVTRRCRWCRSRSSSCAGATSRSSGTSGTPWTEALAYVVDEYPEFRPDRKGLARIEAQRAFALAAQGERAGGVGPDRGLHPGQLARAQRHRWRPWSPWVSRPTG